MPRYDYRCPSCRKRWEAFHYVDDRHNERCPRCEALAELQLSLDRDSRPQFYKFTPYLEHNLEDQPVLVDSPRSLDRKMKEHGLVKIPARREV